MTDKSLKGETIMMIPEQPNEAKSLENLFLAFARAALVQMESQKRSGSPHFRAIVLQDGPAIIPSTKYGHFSFNRDFLREMEEGRRCAKSHWEEGIPRLSESDLQMLNGWEEDGRPVSEVIEELIKGELMHPVIDTINDAKSFNPSNEQLLEKYYYYRSIWENPDIANQVIFPLTHFRSDIRQISTIGTRFQLAPFPPEERATVWNKSYPYDWYQLAPIEPDIYEKSTTFKLIASHDGSEYPFIDEAGDILTTLRLWKLGAVAIPVVFVRHASAWLHRTKVAEFNVTLLNDYRIHKGRRKLGRSHAPYILDETDLPEINTLFNALQTLSRQNSSGKQKSPNKPLPAEATRRYGELDMAIRRFNQSYLRDLPEDQIIDLAIVLESTLLAKERDELNYRLSLRGAALLADQSQWGLHKSQMLLKIMYEVRSGIVHNGQYLADLQKSIDKLKPFEIQPQDFAQQCENIVRDILRTYVFRRAEGKSLETINQELERQILEGLKPETGQEGKTTQESKSTNG
jgi:hypothetical protein